MKSNLFKVVALILCLMLVLIGCSNSGSSGNNSSTSGNSGPATNRQSGGGEGASSAGGGGELHIAITPQPPAIDPMVTTAIAAVTISRNVVETLFTFDNSYKITPMLAESYNVTPDGKTITIQLRQGVKFHNGKDLTAEDVVASLNRYAAKSVYAAALKTAAISAADGSTVTIELDNPSYAPLYSLSMPSAVIMPKEVIESAPETGITELVGTGPFALVEWKLDQYVHLKKYDGYEPSSLPSSGLAGKREALVDEVFFHFVTDSSTRMAGLFSGEYDIITNVPIDNYSQLSANNDVAISNIKSNSLHMVFNKKEGALSNPLMRQAVNAALNNEEIMIGAFSGSDFFLLDHGLMFKEVEDWYSDVGKEFYNQNNAERAKELLAQARYNGESIRILTSRDYDFIYNASLVIQRQLQNAGMNVELLVYDWATLNQKRTEPGSWEIFLTFLSIFKDPSQIIPFNPAWPGWSEDPKLIDLFNSMLQSPTVEEARQYLEQLQQYNWEEYLAYNVIGKFSDLNAYRSNVKGLEFNDGPIIWNVSK